MILRRLNAQLAVTFLHPQMFFIDFTLVEKHGKINVEPFTFSGGRRGKV